MAPRNTPKPAHPAPPNASGPTARAVWDAIVGAFELDEHELALLIEVARTLNGLDALDAEIATAGVVIVNAKGDRVPNPAVVEARAQRLVLARLIASLRLPEQVVKRGIAGFDALAPVEGRPQRRGAARGSYGIRGVAQ